MFSLLFADDRGKMADLPPVLALGDNGTSQVYPQREDMIPLPPGATLVLVPGGHPVGMEMGRRFVIKTDPYEGKRPVWAVAALLPQGYTRLLLPAFERTPAAVPLPLLGYTMAAALNGEIFVAAGETDAPGPWNPCHYNTPGLQETIREHLAASPGNRILGQLARCSLEYGCYTAQNIFYRRWEGGIPLSRHCTARCLGCISHQDGDCPSPQERINFTPTLDEVVEVALPHLREAPGAVVSFGQGCEGEPALSYRLLGGAIRELRRFTDQGTLNVNTNAGFTRGISALVAAGVDSLRVSLNSARPDVYQAYYRPRGFQLPDVEKSITLATGAGVYVALNLLVFPGVTDREEELEALLGMVRRTGVRQVQLRNLNIDPRRYLDALPSPQGGVMGMRAFIDTLAAELPEVGVGSYTHPIQRPLRLPT